MTTEIKHHRRIQFLLLLFFFLGLKDIQMPPLDKHDWRQTLTLSIAENFLDHPNLFYPRTDIGGATEGIMASEFPAFNYLLSLFFRLLGTHYWFGRLLNWSISCIGLWFFYRLTVRVLNPRAGYFALLALMGSIVFEYARKSMPDTFALSTTLIGVSLLWSYLESQQKRYLFGGLVLTAVGILSKIPFVLLLTFLIIPFLQNEFSPKAKRNLVLGLVPVMISVVFWYGYWMPYLLEQFKNQLIWPVSLEEGWRIVVHDYGKDSWSMLAEAPFHYKIPFLLAVMGLSLLLTGQDESIKFFVGTYSLGFFAFVLKTGIVFPTHDYYIIPLVPLLAILIGNFLDRLPLNQVYVHGIALVIFATGWMATRNKAQIPPKNRVYLMELPSLMETYTSQTDKIMVNNGQFNPTMMFWAKRRGWTVNQDVPYKTDWMPDFKRDGLQYVLIDRHLNDSILPYHLMFENEHFRLYRP
ncbi:MAG: glycosyltransferase family 39 protein [Saprospiraceae bacterium]|nr:glycosyltransferase family 39 protein [Saprospiraceae bacterium]